jgi:hypothetical protein
VNERTLFAPTAGTRYTIGKDAKAVTALARILPGRLLDVMFRKMLARS